MQTGHAAAAVGATWALAKLHGLDKPGKKLPSRNPEMFCKNQESGRAISLGGSNYARGDRVQTDSRLGL